MKLLHTLLFIVRPSPPGWPFLCVRTHACTHASPLALPPPFVSCSLLCTYVFFLCPHKRVRSSFRLTPCHSAAFSGRRLLVCSSLLVSVPAPPWPLPLPSLPVGREGLLSLSLACISGTKSLYSECKAFPLGVGALLRRASTQLNSTQESHEMVGLTSRERKS